MCDMKWAIWKRLICMHYGTLQGTTPKYKENWEQSNKNNSLFNYNFTLKLQICIYRTEVKNIMLQSFHISFTFSLQQQKSILYF
jgi:hypothetical protein